jgi:anti-anti-sigma factor
VTPAPRCDDAGQLPAFPRPPFGIHVSGGGDCAVITVAGELDGTVADRVARVFDAADRAGSTRFVVVADQLEFIDFTGVEVVALAARRAERRGGGLVVAGANRDIAQVLIFAGQRRLLDDPTGTHHLDGCGAQFGSFALDGIIEDRAVSARWDGTVFDCDDRLRRQADLVGQVDGILIPAMARTEASGSALQAPRPTLVALIRACDRVIQLEIAVRR